MSTPTRGRSGLILWRNREPCINAVTPWLLEHRLNPQVDGDALDNAKEVRLMSTRGTCAGNRSGGRWNYGSRARSRHRGWWGVLLALGACQSGPDAWADLVVLNGTVITVDDTSRSAETSSSLWVPRRRSAAGSANLRKSSTPKDIPSLLGSSMRICILGPRTRRRLPSLLSTFARPASVRWPI